MLHSHTTSPVDTLGYGCLKEKEMLSIDLPLDMAPPISESMPGGKLGKCFHCVICLILVFHNAAMFFFVLGSVLKCVTATMFLVREL